MAVSIGCISLGNNKKDEINGGKILLKLQSAVHKLKGTFSLLPSAYSILIKPFYLIPLLIALCSMALPAADAAQVGMTWDPSSGSVTGYKVHYGSSSENYDHSVDVGNYTSCTISGLQEGETYYFSATAYNAVDESNFSEELAYKIPAGGSGGGGNNIPMVIEAEEMSYHANGAQIGDYWLLWSAGTMNEDVDFPATGIYHFEIAAKGDLALGVGPEMELLIDGQSKGTVFVNTNTSAVFTFKVEVSAGWHEVAIGFNNDYYDPAGIDRNLYVDKITISYPLQ